MSDIPQIIHELWRQHPRPGYVGTCNHCHTESCNNLVWGAGTCADCLTKELGELTSPDKADRLRSAIKDLREIESEFYQTT